MEKLNPSEAQLKVMARRGAEMTWEDPEYAVSEMFAAANSIPEGAPVGTVKQRTDGTFVAVRCGDVSPYPASWVYVRVMPGACEEPYGDDADSWPSYGEITPEPEGCGIGLDGECEGKCRKGYAPVGTIARRPDGEWIAWRTEDGWGYRFIGDEEPNEWPPGSSIADFWPQIRPDEWPEQVGLDWFPPGEEPIVPRPDPTAQQEPGESLARGLDDIAAGRVSRRDDYLEPQPEPKLCSGCYQCQAPKPPGTPRVVDRLGVDEQGSRWLDASGLVWSFKNGWWKTMDDGLEYGCVDPSIRGPFKEILEPRVLPSLDCEEARDGTVWRGQNGWRFWFNGEWRTDNGTRGRDLELVVPRLLRGGGSYTEVFPDVAS